MKWHYFNPSDEACVGNFELPFKRRAVPYQRTYCGQDLIERPHLKHTEFKDRVDCLVCLTLINQIEYDRSGGKHGA